MMPLEDTVVALATGAGTAGLAVVRVTGPEAIGLANKVFDGASLAASQTHRAHHGYVLDADSQKIDEVLALVLRAPHSYTGEDTVEFSCHGSPQAVDEIVDCIVEAGARLAEPGEFTRRAFLNGKLDLTQAEAVVDLIESHSRAARKSALEQLQGRLTERLRPPRQQLIELLGEIEASIDFVEEGIEFFGRDLALQHAKAAMSHIDQLLATASDGLMLRSGIRVSLAGSPNVGKSRLFNTILQSPRSIVTDHPGTTRDIVRETIRLGGLSLNLEDTAGLRAGRVDPVEAIGIQRSRESHAQADIVLFVMDVSRPLQDEEIAASQKLPLDNALLVLNKLDILEGDQEPSAAELLRKLGFPVGQPHPRAIAVSAASGAGVDRLLDALLQTTRLQKLSHNNDTLVAINQRHRQALVRAREALQQFEKDIDSGEPPEVLAADLRTGIGAFGEILGEHFTEEVLDAIFSRFCIGK